MKKRIHLTRTFYVYCIILIISMLLNFLLNISSFEEIYRNSILSKYRQINRTYTKRIESGLNLGKPLYNFSGMEKFLKEIKEKEENIYNVFISQKDGKILYSYNKDYELKYLNENFLKEIENNKKLNFLYNDDYFIASPLFYEEKEIEGYLYIQFHKQIVSDKVNLMIKENINIFLMNLAITLLLMFIILLIIDKVMKNDEEKAKKRYALSLMIIFLISQSGYTFINSKYFETNYIKISNENLNNFSENIIDEIDYFLKLGIKVDKMKNFENFLLKELKEIEEGKEIKIVNNNNETLYSADIFEKTSSIFFKDYKKQKLDIKNLKYYLKYNIFNQGKKEGELILLLNNDIIKQKKKELLLDSLTVLIISLLISYQLILFASIKKVKKYEKIMDDEKNKGIIIQLFSFLFFFAKMIPISSIPIYIREVYNHRQIDIFGLSENMIIGLPITSYMFGAAIFAFIIGFISKKTKLKRVIIFCSFLMFIGFTATVFANNIVLLIIARMVTGFGEGGIAISAVSLIISNYNNKNTALGFGYWASGYGAASICAIPIGGVIAYRFGFEYALVLAAVITFIIIIYSFIFIKSSEENKNKEAMKKTTIKDLNIFNDRNVFGNFFFRIVPFHLVYVGIFQFIMPLMMDDIGISQSEIGRTMTIFGIVYLIMPLSGRLVDKFKNEKIFLEIGSIVIGLTLILFNLKTSPLIFIMVVTGIALGSMIADSGESVFVTSTDKAKEIGEAKLMSIYTSFEGIVMVIAPLLLSFIVTIFGEKRSILLIAAFTIVSALIHFIITKNTRKGVTNND